MPEQRFDRLPPEAGLFMQVWADAFLTELETALDDIETNVADILAAQAAATAAARELARINSYPSPTNVLTAADVGADATITVAAHSRIYPVQGSIDVADVVIPAPVDLTGKSFSTLYYVYYDDTTLTGTTPTYVATTSAPTSRAGAAAGRHFVGEITTPANGAGGTSGSGGAPPGGGAIP